MTRRSTRRRFLATAGVTTAAVTLPSVGSASSTGIDSDGVVVFVYDDGPIEDYTQAFPAHEAFDAPASTGIVTEWIGREDFMGTDWMDLEQLRELENAGWEILSHTTEHTALGTFELTEDAAPEDDRIYVERNRHGYYRGKDVEITDGDETVRRTVRDYGSDDIGQYIDVDTSLGTAFDAGEAIERYPSDHMEEFLFESKRELEGYGFEVDGILCPYDSCDDWTLEFLGDYYDTNANANAGSMHNDPDDYDPLETNRDYFIEFTTPEAVQADLEEVAVADALGVIGAHTFKEEVTEERIYETLERIDELGLEVLTLREAAARFANGADQPDPAPSPRPVSDLHYQPARDPITGRRQFVESDADHSLPVRLYLGLFGRL